MTKLIMLQKTRSSHPERCISVCSNHPKVVLHQCHWTIPFGSFEEVTLKSLSRTASKAFSFASIIYEWIQNSHLCINICMKAISNPSKQLTLRLEEVLEKPSFKCFAQPYSCYPCSKTYKHFFSFSNELFLSWIMRADILTLENVRKRGNLV